MNTQNRGEGKGRLVENKVILTLKLNSTLAVEVMFKRDI